MRAATAVSRCNRRQIAFYQSSDWAACYCRRFGRCDSNRSRQPTAANSLDSLIQWRFLQMSNVSAGLAGYVFTSQLRTTAAGAYLISNYCAIRPLFLDALLPTKLLPAVCNISRRTDQRVTLMCFTAGYAAGCCRNWSAQRASSAADSFWTRPRQRW